MNKLPSLSIFFPFYNDEGTVERQIDNAYKFGHHVAEDLEVIAIHGGASKDNTFGEIQRMKARYPNLVIVDKSSNKEGYAVIKYGFKACTKEWVFYTDGDAQYHLEEDLVDLVKTYFATKADVVNGYKTDRGDGFLRTYLGNLYAKLSHFVFELPIRDTDCDFRLIKNDLLKKITLESTDSSILAELLKKLQVSGAVFVEIPVAHYDRVYGKSNYTALTLAKEKIIGDFTLYMKIRKMGMGVNNLRVFKFGFVGITSIVIQTVIFNVIIAAFDWNPAISAIVADQFAIVWSFIFNNLLTFKDAKLGLKISTLICFAKFYAIVMVSTLIQALVVLLGNTIFGRSFLVDNTFFVIGLMMGFFWNYSMQKKMVWKLSGFGKSI